MFETWWDGFTVLVGVFSRPKAMDLKVLVEAHLNPLLRGWSAYFRIGNSTRKFASIDNYVRMRMARPASVKYGLSGINWGKRFGYLWLRNLGIHELVGTVRYRLTHA